MSTSRIIASLSTFAFAVSVVGTPTAFAGGKSELVKLKAALQMAIQERAGTVAKAKAVSAEFSREQKVLESLQAEFKKTQNPRVGFLVSQSFKRLQSLQAEIKSAQEKINELDVLIKKIKQRIKEIESSCT